VISTADPAAALSLRGKTAAVTGAGGGIGAAIAGFLAAAGARVLACDLPGRPGPEGTTTVALDVSDAAAVRGFAESLGRDGGLDVLVHAAGIVRDAPISKMEDEAWDRVLSVNLDSAFHLLKATLPLLRASRGCVVLVSSINGERGKRGQANYAASKAGLVALGKTAALEMGRHGVRVNAVAPGWIETPMTAGLPDDLRRRATDESALGRLGTPDDVAGAVLFLCSDLARHVTGQVLRVDGGQLTA
jgi:acetoacetyl-CoA reductase/3-oxoacyl-[acyl-carrier protein] reductase